MLTWVLQEPRWRSVEKMLHDPGAEPLLTGPVLTEVIKAARAKGNVSSPEQIAATLTGQGMVVVHPQDDDLIRCAELLELSSANPGHLGDHVVVDDNMLARLELNCPVDSWSRWRPRWCADSS